jgi:hypothetical protein
MPTLRQKVDSFCKDSGTKVGDTDKLRNQVGMLKQELKKVKATHKHELHLAKAAAKTAAKTLKVPKAPKSPKPAKTKRAKMTDEEKGQRRRERAVAKELEKAKGPKVQMNPLPAQAEPMMPAPAAPPSLAPAAQPKGGRTRRRRPVMRW